MEFLIIKVPVNLFCQSLYIVTNFVLFLWWSLSYENWTWVILNARICSSISSISFFFFLLSFVFSFETMSCYVDQGCLQFAFIQNSSWSCNLPSAPDEQESWLSTFKPDNHLTFLGLHWNISFIFFLHELFISSCLVIITLLTLLYEIK